MPSKLKAPRLYPPHLKEKREEELRKIAARIRTRLERKVQT